jgi:hypothetical protein
MTNFLVSDLSVLVLTIGIVSLGVGLLRPDPRLR